MTKCQSNEQTHYPAIQEVAISDGRLQQLRDELNACEAALCSNKKLLAEAIKLLRVVAAFFAKVEAQ